MTHRKASPATLPDDPVLAAKAVAIQFQKAVHLRLGTEVERLTGAMSWEQAVALAVVLAEAIGQDATRLRLVTLASDDEAVA